MTKMKIDWQSRASSLLANWLVRIAPAHANRSWRDAMIIAGIVPAADGGCVVRIRATHPAAREIRREAMAVDIASAKALASQHADAMGGELAADLAAQEAARAARDAAAAARADAAADMDASE